MSRKTELAKNTAILTVGKLCTQCISFFLLPLYTAILSTEEYGTFDLLVTYSALLLPLVNWQLDLAVCKGIRRKCQIYGSILYLGNNNDNIKCYCFGYFENGTPRIVCFHVICTDCYINLFDICIKMLGIYFSKKYSPEYI